MCLLDSLQLFNFPANFEPVRIFRRRDTVTSFEMYHRVSLSGLVYDRLTRGRLAVLCSDIFAAEHNESFLLKAEAKTFLLSDP